MQLTAQVLAELVSGQIIGNPDVKVSSPAKIEEAGEGHITFLGNPKYEDYLYTTQASIVLVPEDFEPKASHHSTLIKVKDVYATLGFLLAKFGNGMEGPKGISEHAQISDSAHIAEEASVGPFSIIGEEVSIGKSTKIYGQVYIGKGVVIGDNVTIYPGAKIYSQCKIGHRCIIHSNAVIGSDGFGFAPTEDGSYKKIEQIGHVLLEDDVEVGANTVIDRATMGATIIRKGTKLDNLIQIAHNVEVGENTVIAALSGIAGSTKIGKNSQLGGQVGIAGHIELEEGVRIQAGSKVNKGAGKKDAKLFGYPAIDYVQYLRAYSVFKKLPELEKKVLELEKRLTKEE